MTQNIITQINIRPYDGDGRIIIPVSLVKAVFTENPRLVEYCRMSDADKTDAEKAMPYVLEALLDLVRRAHRDPVARNVYLSPQRADQVMVKMDANAGQAWEVRPLIEVIRQLFDGVANNLQQLIVTSKDRSQLSLEVQGAASWVPNLYEDEPDKYVAQAKAPLSAHLANTRPPQGDRVAGPARHV